MDGSSSINPLSIAQVSGTTIYNTGQAAADVALVLPAAAAGYSFIATVGTAQAANTWKFTAAGGEIIYLDGVAGTAGQSVITTPVIGSYISFMTFKISGGYAWIARTGQGTWAAGV